MCGLLHVFEMRYRTRWVLWSDFLSGIVINAPYSLWETVNISVQWKSLSWLRQARYALKKSSSFLSFFVCSYLQGIQHGPNREERWTAPEILSLQEAIERESGVDVWWNFYGKELSISFFLKCCVKFSWFSLCWGFCQWISFLKVRPARCRHVLQALLLSCRMQNCVMLSSITSPCPVAYLNCAIYGKSFLS